MADITPMMQQYLNIKEQYSDCILFFRLGDFYEMFSDDARLASKELDLTLTTRDRSKEDPEERIPMCGVPYHSSEAYIARLVAKGYKVAICEQTEDPALAKGLVDREVIRIVTPGTLIESSMLEEGKSNYLCSVYMDSLGAAVCFADISTGEICATSFGRDSVAHIENEIGRFAPAEAVLNAGAGENLELHVFLTEKMRCLMQIEDQRFDYMQSAMHVCEQFDVRSIDELGLDRDNAAVCAVGGLLSYLKDTQKTDISHINSLNFYTDGLYMELDIQTVRNLELVSTIRTSDKKGSLLWAIDKTKTAMGSRLMRSWLSRPLLSPLPIKRRQAAVNELFCQNVARSETVLILRDIGDIERLIGKIVYGTANCRDLEALASSIGCLPPLVSQIAGMKSAMLQELAKMDVLADIKELVDSSIKENPPFSVRDGNMIKDGYHEEVDYLRGLLKNSRGAMADIEAKERERTGKKLRVGYNKVFGYYIEMPRSVSADVPDDYIRKQTLANTERFITPELKELEATLLTAQDKVYELEYQLFSEIRKTIAENVVRIQETAAKVAQLDVLCSLAAVAVKNDYCMPEIEVSPVLEIHEGRHPVVELVQKNSLFVPNDVFMDGEECRTAIITGPNMAGKSTYMRQTAIIILLAQIGSFVPAKSARIGLVDRVFTRIGASDDLTGGKSTFMVEMAEVAEILKNATSKSLLILDEIGRGTSTYDGMAIARAVIEYCTDKKKLGAKTFFATHYHELTAIENEIPGIKNFNISAKKRNGEIIFLRKIIPGGTDDSFGIEIASLAGVPDVVVRRAKALLNTMEAQKSGAVSAAPGKKMPADDTQMSLGDVTGSEIVDLLKMTDINTITPLEAMNLLFKLKKKVQE